MKIRKSEYARLIRTSERLEMLEELHRAGALNEMILRTILETNTERMVDDLGFLDMEQIDSNKDPFNIPDMTEVHINDR